MKKKQQDEQLPWPESEQFRGIIDLHILPSVAAINGARIRELTGNDQFPDAAKILLRTFRALVDDQTFNVGFCIGSGTRFSAIGIAVIERLMMEMPDATLHVVPVVHQDIAWDIVLRHLRSFTGQILLFAFPDSDVYDAGTAEINYSSDIRQFNADGVLLGRLTAAQRRNIRKQESRNSQPPTAARTIQSSRGRTGRLSLDISPSHTIWKNNSDRCLERSTQLCSRIPPKYRAMGRRHQDCHRTDGQPSWRKSPVFTRSNTQTCHEI